MVIKSIMANIGHSRADQHMVLGISGPRIVAAELLPPRETVQRNDGL